MYCQTGDKPVLKYQFTGQSQKVFKSDLAPIEVLVKQSAVDSTSNFSNQGYHFSCYSTNDFFVKSYILRDYYIIDNKIPVGTFEYRFNFHIFGKECNSLDYIGLLYGDPSSIVINPTITCASSENKYSIQVIHNGLVIFKDQGNTNVIFSVECERCPSGTCECKSSIYPGYCCLDCTATAASIRAITNDLRFKNG